MEINHEIEEKGDKTKVELHKQIETLKVEIGTGKNRLDSLNEELKKIDQRREELKRALEQVDNQIKNSSTEKEDIAKKKYKITADLADIQKKIDVFKKKNNIDALGDIDKEMEAIDKEAEQKQTEITSLREQQQEFLRNKDRLEQQIKTVEERIDKVDEVKKEYKKEIENLKDMKNEFKKLTLELNKKLNEDSNLAAQLGNAKSRSFKLEQEYSQLNAKRMDQQATAAAGTAVQKILENKNRFPGVYGTVADLGKAKGQYGLALEVAAGPRLKSIVVEDDSVAAKCIQYLKDNRFGVAPFIPLNKIRDTEFNENAKKFLKSKGVHGMAIDLIEFDPKYQKAFRYVFGSTLIVENVDDARKIGIGNVRMVTLEGDLMELSGAMIGGYRQKTKSAFQDKDSESKLTNVEKDLEEERRLIEMLEGKRQKLDEAITELRNQKANLEGEIIKLEKSLHLESSDLDASMQAKSEFEKELKQIDKKLDGLQDSISSSNSQFAQLKIKKQQLRDKISALRNPMLVAELTTFEQKKEEFRQELGKLDIDFTGIDKQLSTIFTPEKERIARILKQQDKEEQDFEATIKELKDRLKSQEKELAESEKKEKEFYEKFKAFFGKRNKLNEEVQKIELKIIRLEEESRKNETKVNEVNIDSARINAEMAGLVEEVRQYGEFDELKRGLEELKTDIYDAEKDLREFGNVNMKALEIYEHVETEYNELIVKKDTLKKERDDVMMLMDEIEGKKKELFMNTFNTINDNFKRIFSQLLTKGEANIELENQENPFEAGVMIKVRITGKKFLDIRSLSGGEKTLTALAFIFSIQENDPASFYVLDEVDAALDKRNAEVLSKLIRKYADKAQYIMISHNDGVISEADNLYGVSMNEFGMSKVVSLKI
jgi:chromosome segregation protein